MTYYKNLFGARVIVWLLVLALLSGLTMGACSPATLTEPVVTATTEPVFTTSPEPQATAIGETPVLKIGFVTFLSGAAAPAFGIPSRNAVEVAVELLNEGTVPAPYDAPGIGGMPIEIVYVDEAGGAEVQEANLRQLVLEEKVDVVIGYVSSGDCDALAPVTKELQKLVVYYTCGTNSIFEEGSYEYLFRTNAHQIIDNVGAARYIADQWPGARTVSGINQNYSWGHDSWGTFVASLDYLQGDVQVDDELFPELFAGEFSTEISTLKTSGSDVIHSSFWGSDVETLVIQGAAQDLQEQSVMVLTTGDTMLPRLGANVPPGIVVGGRGPTGALAPESELNTWFVSAYQQRFNERPSFSAYHAIQAILGVKAAYEKAIADNNVPAGALPAQEQVIDAFTYLEYDTPAGTVSMALGNGHQAVTATAYGSTGEYNAETGEVELVDIVYYPVECVNPPEGVASDEWIASGFEGATCP